MIVKKLAVPLINDKILPQVEYCTIATAAISDSAFDFIRTRIPPKCKIDIVTGLDGLTSPDALRRIWRHYQGRITLRIYTKNTFHANVFIFDLPFRKSVAFTGSGDWTMGGLKDSEEIFHKISDMKEIETLKSWFVGYFEYAEELTEGLIDEYEKFFPLMKQREIATRQEKADLLELTTRGFNWETIKFKSQFFSKANYLTLSTSSAALTSSDVQTEREAIQSKLIQLHGLIKDHFAGLGTYEVVKNDSVVSSVQPKDAIDQQIRSVAIGFGRRFADASKENASQGDFARVEISLQHRGVFLSLVMGRVGEGRLDREKFKARMEDVEFRTTFFKSIQGLGSPYWVEVFGERKSVESFQSDEALLEFIKADDWRYYTFTITRIYKPGDPSINTDKIAETMMKEAERLVKVFHLVRN